jgi:hydrogenase-4 component E
MWLELSLISIVFLGVLILGSSRLKTTIQLFALQSFILSLIPFMIHPCAHAVVLGLGTVTLKVILMPMLFFWTIRHVSIRREVQPLIGYGNTLLLSGFLIGVAFLIY